MPSDNARVQWRPGLGIAAKGVRGQFREPPTAVGRADLRRCGCRNGGIDTLHAAAVICEESVEEQTRRG